MAFDCGEKQISRRGLLGAAGLTGLVAAGVSTELAYAAPGYTGDTLVVLSLQAQWETR